MKKKIDFTTIEHPSMLDFFSNDVLSANEMGQVEGGNDWCVNICIKICSHTDCPKQTCGHDPCVDIVPPCNPKNIPPTTRSTKTADPCTYTPCQNV